ncbi:MAG TPA: His/Gly/Thr/Pro-type tRNA ligase C-terminal domain-containing protein, partial [Methylomirabilota bacterium]|nr:His/Gly/Thr/Pro-type tRNA ligase C-terminal domain-containing protein [Methylomirabilota bacterium]
TFEITAPGLGSQDAICGGGRYDGLVELLGGPPTKGIGFAIGTDRLILSLQQGGGNLPAFWRGRPSLVDKQYGGEAPSVFIAWSGKESYGASVKLARRLRAEGFRVEVPADEMKFRKSLSLANRLAASWAVIIGGVELESGVYGLKDLSTGVQYQLNENDLVKKIRDEESHPHVTLS